MIDQKFKAKMTFFFCKVTLNIKCQMWCVCVYNVLYSGRTFHPRTVIFRPII